ASPATSSSSRSSSSGCRTATRSTPTRRGRSVSARAGCSPRSRRLAWAATASSSGPTSRGPTSTASTGRSTASAASRKSSRNACSGRTTRSCLPDVADQALRIPDLDERQLLVELQSLGVRVEDDTGDAMPSRRGGAGPSDALFLWVRGLPLTVPRHAAFVNASPYTIHLNGGGAMLYRDDEVVGPVRLPPRPRIYDMRTADGIPYWKIALLHLDSIASTVVQKCIYWGTDEQCGFCGIELTRGEQTIPVKSPAQLAEVCTAARDYDG